MNTNTIWQSVKGSKKAFVAGIAVLLTFVLVTLSHNGGKNLTLREWIYAGVAYAFVHGVTWLVSNEGSLPIGKLLAALMSNPTVTTALASIGIINVSPLVEPTALPPAPVPADVVTVSLPAAPAPVAPAPVNVDVPVDNTTTLTSLPDAPPPIPLINTVTASSGRHRAASASPGWIGGFGKFGF